MNIRRLLSYAAVAILGGSLWTNWVNEHPPQKTVEPTVSSEAPAAQNGAFVPETFNPVTASDDKTQQATSTDAPRLPRSKRVYVKTDTLDIAINLTGGNIVRAELPHYSVSIEDKRPITILQDSASSPYYSQSGLTNVGEVTYRAQQNRYEMAEGGDTLTVTLEGEADNGLKLIKTFTFTRGSYAVAMHYTIKNSGREKWNGSLYTQLVRALPDVKDHKFYARSYNGGSISSPEIPYQKVTYKAMNKANINKTAIGGWAAMQQHYFLSAWIPATQQQSNHFYSRSNNDIYTLGFVSPQISVAAGQAVTTTATLYVGPEIARDLKKLAPNLERTIDYGWLFWISVVLFWLMEMVHWVVGNWGWSIVITTVIIKFILYPLSATSFRSMARMRELQPKMQQLKERHAGDRQAMSRATMELYRKEKINPLGGCLPMLIQIPIFIALYYVIIESVQLRQAPFIFWIHDLAIKDPYYVLPILMGLSMLVQQKLTPSSPDPAQAKMMMFIPVVFTVFFVNFPAGLTLYWLVNNCVQILQQYYVSKTFDSHKEKKARKAKNKKKNKAYVIKK